MSGNGLKDHGAQSEPSRHAPLHVSRAVSGMVTNRFAFADPSTNMNQRFYGGRQDVILNGSNIEVLPSGQWGRRYGTSPWTTFEFPSPPLGGFAFNDGNGNFTVYVDTATNIYQVTPTSGTSIFTKSAGADHCNYLQLGTTLFVSDYAANDNIKIINNKVWNWGVVAPTTAPSVTITQSAAFTTPWTANTVYSTMGLLVDANGNMEYLISVNANNSNPNSNIGTSSNGEPAWSETLFGTTTESAGTPIVWVNLGQILPWAANTLYGDAGTNSNSGHPCAIYDATSKAVFVQVGGSGVAQLSGTVVPPFTAGIGSSYQDGACNWKFLGTFAQLGAWKPSTGYTNWFAPTIAAANVVVQPFGLPSPSNQAVYLQVPSNTGTSASSSAYSTPNWVNVSGNRTNDGNLVWLNLNSSTWAANTTYTQFVVPTTVFGAIVDSNSNFQVCIVTGKTGNSPPTWGSGYGTTTQDGNATWVCVGTAGPRSGSPPSSSTWQKNTKYFLEPMTGFVPPQPIDPNGGSSLFDGTNGETCIISGKSGGSTPSWNATVGGTTTDNGVTWLNTGSFVQNALTWYQGYAYCYAFKSRTATDAFVTAAPNGFQVPNGPPTGSADGSISQASPLFKMPTTLTAVITNISETSGSVVTATAKNQFVVGTTVSLAGLTGATWLNGQIVTVLSSGLSGTQFKFNDATLYGSYGLVYNADTGSAVAPNSNLGAVNVIQGVGSTDLQVDTIVVYRCTDGFTGGPYLEVTEFPAPQPIGGVAQPWTFNDYIADVSLNGLVEADTIGLNAPPPAGLQTLAYSQGRVVSHVGAIVYMSSGPDIPVDNGNGLTGWGANNNFPLTSPVKRIIAPITGLQVFTTTDMWTIIGGPSITQYFPVVVRPQVGVANANSVIQYSGQSVVFTTDCRLLSLVSGQPEIDMGVAIQDQLVLENSHNVSLVLHENGNDKAIYVTDPNGWWRLVPSLWPNEEPCWSPYATINGGCSIAFSIPTTTTTRTMFIGQSTGALLQRDLTTWQDNGVPFAANFTVGGIPLCVDGELAELIFISTTGPRVGSAPVVSYLLNEISGTYQQFGSYKNDPPSLYGEKLAPTSVYRNRYYFKQTMANGAQPEPVWCTDLLINFAFPAENFQNIISRFTVFGGIWNDLEA